MTPSDKLFASQSGKKTGRHAKNLFNKFIIFCSRESIDEIRRIVRDVEKLSKLERLLLYMELPSSLSTLSDPLRQ